MRTGGPTMMRLRRNLRGCVPSMVVRCSGTAIRSAARCPCCSREDCRISTWARRQACLEMQTEFTVAVNGRFKGGYITRHHGRPDAGVQAVQLELAQLNYMDETSFAYDETRAPAVQALIERLLRLCLD